MRIMKSSLKSEDSTKQPNRGRRSFIWKAGVAVSAVLATAVPGIAKARIKKNTDLKTRVEKLSRQVELLEEENAIRSLHKTYENHLNSGEYEEVVDLFDDDAEVLFNSGLFKGKKQGIYRLYSEHFSAGLTGKKMEPAPGFELNAEEQEDRIEVASNCRTAKAQFTYSIQVGTPMKSDLALVRMARLHGGGIQKWWEGGVYEGSYVKNSEGNWRIKRLEYRTLSKADYRPGRSYANPISIASFSKVYPEDQAGPDRLII